MTFLEAAIEILRHAREPLHFAEITKRAVDRKLLSHVGRDPETAMQTCLNSAVRNNTYDGLLLRDTPGHFQLRPGVPLPELPLPPGARAQTLKPPIDPRVAPPIPANPRPRAESDNGDSTKKSGNSNGLREASSKSPKPAPAEPSPVVGRKKSSRRGKKSSRPAEESGQTEALFEVDPADIDSVEVGPVEVAPVEVEPFEVEPFEVTPLDVTPVEIDIDDIDPGLVRVGPTGPSEDDEPSEDESSAEPDAERGFAAVSKQIPSLPMPSLDPSKIRFRGPEGSGLEGDTDIALVMANAVSRIVEERPELRGELEAMQQRPAAAEGRPAEGRLPDVEVVRRRKEERRDDRRDERKDSPAAMDDDRGGRRRRRRRRRSRRTEWSEGGPVRAAGAGSEELLDKVATTLAEAGTRSLHVRQIAEQLANQNVLGGEISEIERAVTAALLLDVHRRGDGSRFMVRGDARYQLRGSRLPEKVAAAEYAARRSLLALEQESEKQLLLWLQALGARSLEAIARIWLDTEDHTVLSTLAPARGLGKLIVEEPESLARERDRGDRPEGEGEDDEGRVLVLLVPRKTAIEPKLWEGEAERNGCAGLLVFAMGDVGADLASPDTRVIGASELARWMIRQRIGVRIARFEVPVLDADLIESIGGLDT